MAGAKAAHTAPSAGPLRGISMKNLTPSLRKQLEIPADISGVVVLGCDPDSPAADYLAQGDRYLEGESPLGDFGG